MTCLLRCQAWLKPSIPPKCFLPASLGFACIYPFKDFYLRVRWYFGVQTSLLLGSDDVLKVPLVVLCIYQCNYDIHISIHNQVFYKHYESGWQRMHCLQHQSTWVCVAAFINSMRYSKVADGLSYFRSLTTFTFNILYVFYI